MIPGRSINFRISTEEDPLMGCTTGKTTDLFHRCTGFIDEFIEQ
jgi:hypothetical protein